MELRIILKDPADGNPLDIDQVIPGVWSDCATIGWKLTYEGKEYGNDIIVNRGADYETFEEGVLLMLKDAFAALSALAEVKAHE